VCTGTLTANQVRFVTRPKSRPGPLACRTECPGPWDHESQPQWEGSFKLAGDPGPPRYRKCPRIIEVQFRWSPIGGNTVCRFRFILSLKVLSKSPKVVLPRRPGLGPGSRCADMALCPSRHCHGAVSWHLEGICQRQGNGTVTAGQVRPATEQLPLAVRCAGRVRPFKLPRRENRP
jgi:hypothetical protein